MQDLKQLEYLKFIVIRLVRVANFKIEIFLPRSQGFREETY